MGKTVKINIKSSNERAKFLKASGNDCTYSPRDSSFYSRTSKSLLIRDEMAEILTDVLREDGVLIASIPMSDIRKQKKFMDNLVNEKLAEYIVAANRAKLMNEKIKMNKEFARKWTRKMEKMEKTTETVLNMQFDVRRSTPLIRMKSLQ